MNIHFDTHNSRLKYLPIGYVTAAMVVLILTFTFFRSPLPTAIEPEAIGPYLNNTFTSTTPGNNGNWTPVNAFPTLTFEDPVAMVEIPGESKFFVVGKAGKVWTVDHGSNTKKLVLSIEEQVKVAPDAGVLNIALHPEFAQAGSQNQGFLYLYYTYTPEPAHPGVIFFDRLSRFQWSVSEQKIDPDSETVLIQQFDRNDWHNGGGMFFGPDGLLYLSVGDEGGVEDQFNTSQKINDRLLSGLLRIDVDQDLSRSHAIRRFPILPPGKPDHWPDNINQGYTIPNDNPWVNANGANLEEFYAIGLRSPHRISYDELTEQIWVADVGQEKLEEITIIEKGDNAQWAYREGTQNGAIPKPANLLGNESAPVYQYGRSEGNSIIGGFVYRGSLWSSLDGLYIFGDHGSQNVWSLDPLNNEVKLLTRIPVFGIGDKSGISSFATDSQGEIYVLKLFGTNLDGGIIYRLEQAEFAPDPPTLLSQTGAFIDLEKLTPAPGLIPYNVNSPLWSDGAAKQRWVALPNDGIFDTNQEQIAFFENANWVFPKGTVFIKHFELPVDYQNPTITRSLETRFLVVNEAGAVYGVTYKWNAAGTDATLLTAAYEENITVNTADGPIFQTWSYPGRNQCLTCHNANADFVLGVKTVQLNGSFTYPKSNETANQLQTLNQLGALSPPINEAEIVQMLKSVPLDDDKAGPELKVRSYLDANCSFCHQPNGVEGAFDARLTTPLGSQGLVNSMAISRNSTPNGQVVVPGDVAHSELWLRATGENDGSMPPLATNVVDEEFVQTLESWIIQLDAVLSLPDHVVTPELPVKIFPNPFEQSLFVQPLTEATSIQRLWLRVYDLSGRVIYQNFEHRPDQTLEISTHWPAGIYTVHLKAGNLSSKTRVLKL